MKPKLITLLCLSVLTSVAQAASDNRYETPASHKLDHLAQVLQLSPEQKNRIDEIFKAQHEKFAAIHKESHDKVTALLSPEQAAKWEEMRRQHQAELQKQSPAQ